MATSEASFSNLYLVTWSLSWGCYKKLITKSQVRTVYSNSTISIDAQVSLDKMLRNAHICKRNSNLPNVTVAYLCSRAKQFHRNIINFSTGVTSVKSLSICMGQLYVSRNKREPTVGRLAVPQLRCRGLK
jgi:hypothetical protein